MLITNNIIQSTAPHTRRTCPEVKKKNWGNPVPKLFRLIIEQGAIKYEDLVSRLASV